MLKFDWVQIYAQITKIPLIRITGHYNLPSLKEFRLGIQTNHRAQARKPISYQTSFSTQSSYENYAVLPQTYLLKSAHRSHRALKAY